VQELNAEIEKFPRKNRHSNEWHEKYTEKFRDLELQKDSVDQTQTGIKDLLIQLNVQKQKAIEENFVRLRQHFVEIF